MTGEREPYDFVAAGRRGAEKRWAAHRAERIAQGLAPTRDAERGTKPDRFDDPEVEAYWMDRAGEMGLYPATAGRTQQRRIAHRLAEAETKAIIEAAESATPTNPPSDGDVLATYHEREIARLTAQRSAELARAALAARLITEHETALVEAMRREARA